ncbi:hypothetical protein AR457_38465 [Streptomyces agglomeratus]|uniref:DUF4328 domain-containing protein n=1 Tax=Streptomyces agglomeratus TaxID=285458 RepID=UPI0008542345|nr:DUF4328 domain-containing protein [Streptomyces agglomeratus]OEJ23071.1 hypothetical protein AR457_38465 [Streptomyces agglomeratus]
MGRRSGVVACLGLGLNIALAITLLGAQMRLYGTLGRMPHGEPIVRAEMWVGKLAGVQTAAVAGTALLFVLWFSQAGERAESLGSGSRWKGQKWTMGAWVIPVVNVVLPLLVALHIWSSSQPDDTARRRSRLWVLGWWTLFLSWTYADGHARDLYRRAEETEPIRAALRAGMVSDVLCVLAAIAAIAFVAQLTRIQSHQVRCAHPTAQA